MNTVIPDSVLETMSSCYDRLGDIAVDLDRAHELLVMGDAWSTPGYSDFVQELGTIQRYIRLKRARLGELSGKALTLAPRGRGCSR